MAVRSSTRVKDSESVSSLFDACKTGDTDAVKRLATPDNVNSRDLSGRKSTPLHFAAGKQNEMCQLAGLLSASVHVCSVSASLLPQSTSPAIAKNLMHVGIILCKIAFPHLHVFICVYVRVVVGFCEGGTNDPSVLFNPCMCLHLPFYHSF